MRVVIVCGISGAGKTTWREATFPGAYVGSADHYFMASGSYVFVPADIGKAHGQCFRGVVTRLQSYYAWERENGAESKDVIVVDNTNLSVAEIAPYAAAAQAYGAELDIVTVLADVETAAARNTHGVPMETIQRMAAALATRELPPWWPHRTVGPF